MEILSRKFVLALSAVMDIAYYGGPEPVQSKEITERQAIPQRYLEQVMQQLVKAGVLKGVRGPRGGYRLARERRRISAGDIARVVSGVERPEDPSLGLEGSDLGRAVVRPFYKEIRGEVMRKLDSVTIDELCRRARHAGIESALHETLDYSI